MASSVIVPVRSVDVPMRQLFLRRLPYALDLDVEVEMLAGERMIAVESHHVALHVCDGHRSGACLRLRVQMHAWLNVLDAAQSATGNALHEALVVLAVAFRGRNPHADLVADVMTRQLPLQSRDDVAVAMQVGERLAGGGAVDDRARVVFQGVV